MKYYTDMFLILFTIRNTLNHFKDIQTTTEMIRTDHMKLVRSIAWSFYYTTGLSFEDLFAEACLGYSIARKTYDDTRPAKFSTYLVSTVKIHLVNYAKKEKSTQTCSLFSAANISQTPVYEYWECYKPDIQTIINIVRNSNGEISGVPPKMARGVIRRELREQGWSWPRIWDTIRETKQMVYETPIGDLTICES